jgi:hypothetical protein
MSPRLLPFGLIALLGFADSAAARPRRLRRSLEMSPAAASPATPAREALKQVVYPVADLIVPIPSRENLDVEPLPRAATSVCEIAGPECEARPNGAWRFEPNSSFEESGLSPLGTAKPQQVHPGRTLEHELMELVTSTVAPRTWMTTGGPGSVQYHPLSMSLVVTQTPAVQEEVQALLAALRRLQDVQAVVELRAVTVAPAVFERACRQMNITRDTEEDNPVVTEERAVGPKGKRWTASLDDCQVQRLLHLVQADPSANVTQAPKMTTFSGQKVALSVTEDRFYVTGVQLVLDVDSAPGFIPAKRPFATGLRIGLQSTVTADRGSARVQMKGTWCQLAGPVERHVTTVASPALNDEEAKPARFGVVLQKPKFSQVRLDQNVTIADGSTVLISCGVVPVETPRDDFSACWHEFWTGEKLTTSADQHVFFLLTSRVIVNEEHEVPTSVAIPREARR